MTRTARVALSLAAASLLVHWAVVGWATARSPRVLLDEPGGAVALVAPPALTVVAALLARGDRTPVALGVAVGSGLMLIGGVFLLDQMSGLKLVRRTDLLRSVNRCLTSGYPMVPVALVVFLPAWAGWRQRRRERLAADD